VVPDVLEGAQGTILLHIFNSKEDKLGYIESEANKQENLLSFALAVTNGYMIPYKPAIEEMLGWNVDDKKPVFLNGCL